MAKNKITAKNKNWMLTEEEKQKYIGALEQHLSVLRAKVGISQDELSYVIGVSRQTYCAVERKTRKMSWNTYLALVAFFDYHAATHTLLRALGAFPTDYVERLGGTQTLKMVDMSPITDLQTEQFADKLDEQAKHTIRAVTILEYARCMKLSSEAIVYAFEGNLFSDHSSEQDAVKQSLKRIKEKKKDQ